MICRKVDSILANRHLAKKKVSILVYTLVEMSQSQKGLLSVSILVSKNGKSLQIEGFSDSESYFIFSKNSLN